MNRLCEPTMPPSPAVSVERVALVDAVGRLVAASAVHSGGRITEVSRSQAECAIGPWYNLDGCTQRWLAGSWTIEVIKEPEFEFPTDDSVRVAIVAAREAVAEAVAEGRNGIRLPAETFVDINVFVVSSDLGVSDDVVEMERLLTQAVELSAFVMYGPDFLSRMADDAERILAGR